MSYFSVLEVNSMRFGSGNEALEWIELMRSRGNVNPNFICNNNDERLNQMIEFIRTNKIDLFCIQESRNFFSKFFRQNISKHLPQPANGPMLVITL